MHRDIKPQNILVNANCDSRICDFGMARAAVTQDVDPLGPMPDQAGVARNKFAHAEVTYNVTNYCSSRWYRSPEQLVNATNYSTAIDIWALGCVIGEMVQRRPLFPGTCTLSQLSLIVHITGRPPDVDLTGINSRYVVPILEGLGKSKEGNLADILTYGTPEVHDLVRLCLQFNPDKRLTATEALEHPFIGHFHHPDVELNHSSAATGGITLPLSDDIQYSVSAYRDRIYADFLGRKRSIDRVNRARQIKQELANTTGHERFSSNQSLTKKLLGAKSN